MSISKKDAIRALQTSEKLYVAYSRATSLPYVICDKESYNDQAWFFSTEEGVKEFGKLKQEEDKSPLAGMCYNRKNFPELYSLLYAIGANSIVWNKGSERVEVELSEIAKQKDISKMDPKTRPLLNPTLQLTAMYFLQELRRPVPNEEKTNLREMEEEVLANLVKSEFLMAMQVDPKDPKKMNILLMKSKDGKVLQPFFSDVMEYAKFVKNQKLRMVKVPFLKVPDLLVPQAEGLVINPLGFNLPLNKELLTRILGTKVKE